MCRQGVGTLDNLAKIAAKIAAAAPSMKLHAPPHFVLLHRSAVVSNCWIRIRAVLLILAGLSLRRGRFLIQFRVTCCWNRGEKMEKTHISGVIGLVVTHKKSRFASGASPAPGNGLFTRNAGGVIGPAVEPSDYRRVRWFVSR